MTFDHRLFDGHEAHKTMNAVTKFIENPELLPLE